MPRKLPWLPDSASNHHHASVKRSRPVITPAPSAATPRASSSSSPSSPTGSNLVASDDDDDDDGDDDDDLGRELGAVNRRRDHDSTARHREPSSSPPPPLTGPPPVEFMTPGYQADDIFIMVEDELYSTAQIYTRHIHQAEYMRLKKLHRSRGQETLAALGHGTDHGRTKPSRALRLKMEAQEKARKRMAPPSDDEEEDEYMHDPQLAGLMTRSQAPVSQSLYKSSPRKSLHPRAAITQEEEDTVGEDHDDETDDDDLDVPVKASRPLVPPPKPVVSSSEPQSAPMQSRLTTKPSIFNQFSRGPSHDHRQSPARSPPLSPPPRYRSPSVKEEPGTRLKQEPAPRPRFTSTVQKHGMFSSGRSPSPGPEVPVTIKTEGNITRAAGFLAKRKAAREKAEMEKKRKMKEEDSIPTFLF